MDISKLESLIFELQREVKNIFSEKKMMTKYCEQIGEHPAVISQFVNCKKDIRVEKLIKIYKKLEDIKL